MEHEPVRARQIFELHALARERDLVRRVDRLEGHVARLTAQLDGASVTLLPAAEMLRPPAGPDMSIELQRIAAGRPRNVPDSG